MKTIKTLNHCINFLKFFQGHPNKKSLFFTIYFYSHLATQNIDNWYIQKNNEEAERYIYPK